MEMVYELYLQLTEEGIPVSTHIQAALLEAGYDLAGEQ